MATQLMHGRPAAIGVAGSQRPRNHGITAASVPTIVCTDLLALCTPGHWVLQPNSTHSLPPNTTYCRLLLQQARHAALQLCASQPGVRLQAPTAALLLPCQATTLTKAVPAKMLAQSAGLICGTEHDTLAP